ncbi:MAG: MotA/TolQ/ExbB proton channel family protein [Rhodospirillaceae bacterium]|nr:MotA/TolQ/ExbB proton channel family protein [Rhodospirillaceae bacterium]MDD9917070.1 MotA/TolQ/ExbB proton channel family protein [Rhodospirillaceae bacterium]
MELISKPHRYLLFLRFLLVNLVALALLFAAWLQGWLDGIFVPVTMELSLSIFVVFLFGLFTCGNRIWQTSVELNDIRSGDPKEGTRAAKYLATVYGGGADSKTLGASALRLKMGTNVSVIRHLANGLIFLGLIGTVIGFIIALSGVDPESATEIESVANMVATLISGMSVALYTTLVGAVLYVWLIVNHRILTSGAVSLIGAIIELGEARERA